MEAIPRDKLNYDKLSKEANILIFKEFYPKTQNVSYFFKTFTLNIPRYFYKYILYEINSCIMKYEVYFLI